MCQQDWLLEVDLEPLVLFKTNEAGHILPNSMKSYHELQEDFYMHNDV